MIPHRDDVEAIAGVAGLLLEARDPGELAERFLAHVARVFHSDAGLFYAPGEESPRLRAIGLDADEAPRLAAELFDALNGGARGARRGVGETGRVEPRPGVAGGWPRTLATVVGIRSDRRALVALFSARPDAYDSERDARLLHQMARHVTVALSRARLYRRSREEAERNALRAEAVERTRGALERYSRELEWTLAARSRFFALMSHEMRTPINAILGYAGLLREGVLGELPPGQGQAVEKVASSARQLLALVDDVLDLSKLEAGRLAVREEVIDAAALAAEAAGAVELEAMHKGLELRVRRTGPTPTLRSDGTRVRQVLLNLLSNAVKFTTEGSVTLDVRHIARDGGEARSVASACLPGPDGWVALTVEDTGPGIPATELESIFDEYVQLDGGRGGTGLGLAVSRRLARLLGGELVADSEIGVGSTFVLYLPCPAPTAQERADQASGAAAAATPADRRT